MKKKYENRIEKILLVLFVIIGVGLLRYAALPNSFFDKNSDVAIAQAQPAVDPEAVRDQQSIDSLFKIFTQPMIDLGDPNDDANDQLVVNTCDRVGMACCTSTNANDRYQFCNGNLRCSDAAPFVCETAPTPSPTPTPSSCSTAGATCCVDELNFSQYCTGGFVCQSGFCAEGTAVDISQTTVVQGIRVNVSVATQVDQMLTAMTNAGINFSGSTGWRDYNQQVILREQNCTQPPGQTIDYYRYQAPSGSCNPPTAIPGTSLHEQGVAIDFTCNGATVTRTDACFPWLVQYASVYGFYNLPSEPWHWSITGN